MNKDKNVFTVNDTVLYKNKEYIISRFETLNNTLLVGLTNLNHLVNLRDIEHTSGEYKILEYRTSNNLHQIIWKVERISDGVTFTIGDMCNPVATDYKYNKKPITKIWFTGDGSLRISSENYTLPINGIEHSEMPLFKTEDGVDMYEGDKYYYVSESGKGVYTLITKNEKPLSGNGKRFSTKKAAENYIYNSEKRFSMDDVINAIPLGSDDVTFTLTKMLDTLKNLEQ